MNQDDFYRKLFEQHSLTMSRMVKQGIRHKRECGDWCSKAPRGYRNVHDIYDHHKPKIVKDPEYFKRVKKAFDLMLTGKYTIANISKIVKMDSSFLRRAFRNPFYAGLNRNVDDPTILNKGNWEPMITEVQFNIIQKMLEPKKKQNG